MPRAVWTGSLSFGLVSIPVALYPATSPKDVRFHLFDQQGRRVRYRRFSEPEPEVEDRSEGVAEPEDGPRAAEAPTGEHGVEATSEREVRYEDLVRGYEVEPGRYAMVEDEDLERVRPERSTTIELEDFVELEDIDPVYFEKSYYLAPRRTGARPYALLRATLERTGRVGIGRFVLRTKPHLVAVRATDEAIVLETLFFGDEVRAATDIVDPPEAEATDRELKIAEQLVEMLATAWDPSRYSDEYREELLRIISEKAPVDAPETGAAEPTAPTARAEELMETLKRSVEAAKAKKTGTDDARRAG